MGFLKKPVDAASLAVFRILFGCIMLWEVWRYVTNGWIKRYYIDPEYVFAYEGFSWITPWPGDGMYIHFFVLAVLALLIALGLFYRASSVLFFFAFTYIFFLDQARYLNHFYLICTISFLMMFIPAHRLWSLDALFDKRIRSDQLPGWMLWVLRLQIGIPYFYGGIAKLNHDWLRGEPLSHWIHSSTDFPLIGQYFTQRWMGMSLSYAGLILDLAFVPLLLWKKTRVIGFVLVCVFNVMNAMLFHIGIFPWFMIAGTLLFFEPDWPRRTLARIGLTSGTKQYAYKEVASPRRSVVHSIMIVFVASQLILPFRHWLYPSNVHWSEEGHRFAWHMKLRSKQARGTFTVRNLDTGRQWEEDPRAYLSERQERKMMTRPYMILDFAHYLEDIAQSNGQRNVAVYADIQARLNYRSYQQFTDPTVDLTQQSHTWKTKPWILPLQ